MSDTDPDQFIRTRVRLEDGDIVLAIDDVEVRLNEDEARELADELEAAAAERQEQLRNLLPVLEATITTLQAAKEEER